VGALLELELELERMPDQASAIPVQGAACAVAVLSLCWRSRPAYRIDLCARVRDAQRLELAELGARMPR
jgi:hypothetical protein